jgi:hypothetical protein
VVNPLLQIKVYGAVAPLGVKLIEPLFMPQLAFVTTGEIKKAEDVVTVLDDVAVQLSELVTVTVYEPATRAEMSSVVDPSLQIKV